MVKNKRSKNAHKLSVPEMVMMRLKKLVNAPFEVLLEYGKIRNQISPAHFRTAMHRLQKKGLIHCERQRRGLVFMLTEEGEQEAQKVKTEVERLKPKQWDGKWRIIIFDIPEKLRGKRDLLRRELVGFGFRQLQQSVWVYPHTLPQAFRDLWKETGIFKYCVIFEADKMENGEMLESVFFGK